MKRIFCFYGVGLLIAASEEFITQGVLKENRTGWIAPTLVAFVPFVTIMLLIAWCLKRLNQAGALVIYYAVAGSIGLMVEWFLIGLSPWRDPKAPVAATVVFQAGMFSFWASSLLRRVCYVIGGRRFQKSGKGVECT